MESVIPDFKDYVCPYSRIALSSTTGMFHYYPQVAERSIVGDGWFEIGDYLEATFERKMGPLYKFEGYRGEIIYCYGFLITLTLWTQPEPKTVMYTFTASVHGHLIMRPRYMGEKMIMHPMTVTLKTKGHEFSILTINGEYVRPDGVFCKCPQRSNKVVQREEPDHG